MTATTSPTGPNATVSGPVLRGFMRNWATGVAVVTGVDGVDGQRPVGCTVNAFTSVSLNPPLLLISLSRHSRTLAAITAGNSFAVNMLGWHSRHLADRFTADVDDRFAGVAYRMVGPVPVIEQAMAAAACSVAQVVEAADHVLVLGRPYWCDDRQSSGDPAVFLGGGYHRISAG